MRPLSLAESGLSSCEVSLAGLLDGAAPTGGAAALTLEELVEEICHGGWPRMRPEPVGSARRSVGGVVQEIAHGEIRTVDAVRRDPVRLLAVLRAVARNVSTAATVRTIAADLATGGAALDEETVSAYLDALQRLMVYEPLDTWSPQLRARPRLRVHPKHHLVDPAVAAHLLGAGPDELRLDPKTLGFLFESLVIRDLRVYAGPLYARVHQYRDNTGLEVDAVVDAGMGRWAAFEVKLGGGEEPIDRAAKSLARFAAKVDTQSAGAPACLAVITASGYAYTRPDGIAVIPLATLGP
jgi:predicted AAA+ superfamily ATPase